MVWTVWILAYVYAFIFIHSFITDIYIAPLQGYYSEALPTLARLKRRVLRINSFGSFMCSFMQAIYAFSHSFVYDKKRISVTSHALNPPSLCHKLSHLLGPPPPRA